MYSVGTLDLHSFIILGMNPKPGGKESLVLVPCKF